MVTGAGSIEHSVSSSTLAARSVSLWFVWLRDLLPLP